MVIELSSGPFIALEITSETCNVYNDFRQMCGPSDPVSVIYYSLSYLLQIIIIIIIVFISAISS